MKVLNFYVRGAGNTLVRYCLEYLVDAGYNVYFDAGRMNTEDHDWVKGFTHGLAQISHSEVNYETIDYIIDFTDSNSSYPKPRVDIDISFDKDIITSTVVLIDSVMSLEIPSTKNIFSIDKDDYANFAKRINECLIDGIISLSREYKEEYKKLNVSTSNIRNIAKAENEIRDLSSFYKIFDGIDVFKLKNSLYGLSESDESSYLKYKIPTKSTEFTEIDLQILGLFLLSTINAKKQCGYGYLYQTKGKRIIKYIDLTSSDSYESITSSLCNSIYDVAKNQYYIGPSTHEGILCLAYDDDINNCLSPITITFSKAENSIQIQYNKSYIFFDYINDYLDLFYQNIDEFRRGSIGFSDMLTVPTKHLEMINNVWNNTFKKISDMTSITSLFNKQVKLYPNDVAVISGNSSATYSELDAYSNQLANFIIEKTAHTENRYIGVLLERNYHLIASLLAIIKSGRTYIPLDSKYPKERIDYVIENSKMGLLLTDKKHYTNIYQNAENGTLSKPDNTDVYFIDDCVIQSEILNHESTCVKSDSFMNNDLAYVIFTSGTTGKPKGVAIKHISLLNLLLSFKDSIAFSNSEKLLSVTTIAFDISGLEIFLPLISGAKLVLASESDLLNPKNIIRLIHQHEITVIQATPALWSLLLQETDGKKLPIKALCGGEALQMSLAKKLSQSVTECWNVYGPTETTIWSTTSKIDDNCKNINIGKPIANTSCHIIGEDRKELPIGIVGELYIGGQGLAACYLNRDDLTQEKFIPINLFKNADYFTNNKNTRLYKTGDLARWSSDGNLEYFGRNDFQVKIRGFRIELSEIEQVLMKFAGIKQCVVTVNRKNGKEDHTNDIIVAYYISQDELSTKSIEDHLAKYLPDYMLPKAVIKIETMPLNVNGKLDRSKLPDPTKIISDIIQHPSTDTEKKLAIIWSDILGIDSSKVDVRDDFFSLGGNSITAIRLINRINSEIYCDIKISDIFLEKTLEKLAILANKSMGSFEYSCFLINEPNKQDLFEPFTMNNVQQSYYLGRNQNFDLSNVSTHVYSEHSFGEIDRKKLEDTYNTLLSRHLALRSIFENNQQRYLKSIPWYVIKYHEHDSLESFVEIRKSLSHKLYDPSVYPLFDVVISKYENKYILHLSFDAIIIDMGSFEILFKEWIGLYNNNLELKPLKLTHRDYVINYEKIRNSDISRKAESYWENKISSYNFNMPLPLRSLPSDITKPHFNRITKTIDKSIWDKIVEKSRLYNLSPTSVVLEAYGKIISYWSGQQKICINLTLFNRLPLHPDVDKIIGDFTVLELFDYHLNPELTISQKIKHTHNNLLLDIENNIYDGIDFQRMIKAKKILPPNQVVAPIVLTSVIGNDDNESLFNFPLNESYKGTEYSISQTSQVWLDHKAYVTKDGFIAEWDYVEQLFQPEIISEMHESYCDLIIQLATQDWSVDKMPTINLSEKNYSIVQNANNTIQPIPSMTIHDQYEKNIADHNFYEKVAIIDDAKQCSYTYKQLIDESLFLSKYIIDVKLKSRSDQSTGLIGVLSEKGYTQMVGVCSIMKSGNAYLPLNVEWPIERILEVLNQANVKDLLLSNAQYSNAQFKKLLSKDFNLIFVDDLLSKYREDKTLFSSLNALPSPLLSPDSIAYVIFTSGSTGKPKGVTITHRAVMNTILAMINRFNINENDAIFALSELSFDLSVFDLFAPLMVGAKIIFPDQVRLKDTQYWLEAVDKFEITIWNTVPQLANLLIDEMIHKSCKKISTKLRVFLLSGDWIPIGLPGKIKRFHHDATVMSLGGATEGSIWSIWYEVNDLHPSFTKIPYGTAMPNQKMYILNSVLEHCPVGVVGDIYIGGIGIALNYFGDETLTNKQFIIHPQLGRLYKTGDLGKWHHHGYIEFMGRNDNQVKLNGYRVELEEISAKIKQFGGIKEVITTINKDNNSEALVSYILPDDNVNISPSITKSDFVSKQLAIIKKPSFTYKLSPIINKDDYAIRKSYRSFTNDIPDISLIQKCCDQISKKIRFRKSGSGELKSLNDLERILSVISGIQNEKDTLPKYRYPSASSTYPIRCFFYTSGLNQDLKEGYYYYNPIDYTLSEISKQPPIDSDKLQSNEIFISIHWPAILPLYEEHSERLAWIEIGHILSLMTSAFEELNLGYQVNICNQSLDGDNQLAIRIKIGRNFDSNLTINSDIRVFSKNTESNLFVGINTNRNIDLNDYTLFNRLTSNGCLLERGKMLLTLEQAANVENYIASGIILQEIGEALAKHDIGSCLLGSSPYEGVICSMIIGKIDPEEKTKLRTKQDQITIDEFLAKQLSDTLPTYMIPQMTMIISEIPLTANGKVDKSRLPKPSFTKQYQAPESKTEKDVAALFANILDSNYSMISVNDSFFDLGGNSLSAMQLIMQIRNQYTLDIKLSDLYANNSIKKLVNKFNLNTKPMMIRGSL